YIPANPLSTPPHIVPEWYLLPFYAILRAIPDKLGGVVAMFGAIAMLAVLPWLDTSKVRSAVFRPIYKQFFWLFVINSIILGYLGSQPPEGWYLLISRIATFWYFAHFLLVMPLLGIFETPRPLPESITKAVLGDKAKGGTPSGAAAAPETKGLAAPFGASMAAEGGDIHIEIQKWTFGGVFGHYDRAQLQRGFQIYKESCSSCHSMKYVSFRNLGQPGGPEFSEAAVKVLAAEVEVTDGPDEAGDMFDRPGIPSDAFPSPFANDNAARASNGGALPPDLSVIAKARSYHRGFPGWLIDVFSGYQEHGADYVHALLTGYVDAPGDFELQDSMNYNAAFPGHQIAMASPLSEYLVEYSDGTKASVDQMSRDVTAFLMWAAEPHLEARKKMGFKVIIFLIIFAALLYAT
ncbi:UNVERIFIED_CONTAM: hypothetical protein GTU68_016144, partial [Idotea baltica]|nr:hypothetical protein [Idotea baltica]